jgi:hypothetical protein
MPDLCFINLIFLKPIAQVKEIFLTKLMSESLKLLNTLSLNDSKRKPLIQTVNNAIGVDK